MRRLFYIIILLIDICFCANAQNRRAASRNVAAATENPLAVEGVSQELAQHRKKNISGLHYNLHFNIPSDPSAPITATDGISFQMKSLDDLVLDFRESADKIKSVTANKKPVPGLTVVNEHITIPKRYLHPGENTIVIEFIAGNQSLNRQQGYMYTLFVPDRARTAFPCFDQPDLKAIFHLSLSIPGKWIAVANGAVKKHTNMKGGRSSYEFTETEPLPTYLFAFAAGEFQQKTYSDGRREISAYYRETDSQRVAQLPEIARQVFYSLNWQERFTRIKYPFRKYDFVVIPGFQFGGMEHTGCTFYNDNTLFLPENPTADEELARAQLIAHETSHMWFGDYVTMRWFNDVWTKEVFANYFAAAITRDEFPEGNHDLLWLKNYTSASLTEDRTEGRTAIRQNLDNLNNAGLIYNNIVYNKAPIVMRKLVDLMGEEAFQRGIRRYMKEFAFGNATWEELVDILDSETDADLKAFCDVWVNQKGMPTISLRLNEDSDLANEQVVVDESDPLGRGLLWPQKYENQLNKFQILPNYDGRGYGFFTLGEEQLRGLMQYWHHETDATAKQSLLITLHENYLAGKISDDVWVDFLVDALTSDQDKLTVSTLVSYLSAPMWLLSPQKKAEVEDNLLFLAETHSDSSARIQLLRQLVGVATSAPVVESLYFMWLQKSSDVMSVNDYMTFAYELAIRYPGSASEIIREQRSRLTNPDRLRQFDYVSRAVSQSPEACDTLFNWLLVPENRRIEPWAGQALYYLNHPLRDQETVHYIQPALMELQDVQRTGDIFFPSRWCNSLLAGHHCVDAYIELLSFFTLYPDYPELLKNKIHVAAYELYRQYGQQQ